MGQNIGTCVTALLSSVGANKNARRAALVHFYFNLIGTIFVLVVFYTANMFFQFSFVHEQATAFGIAVIHTCFNVVCTVLLFPFTAQLERLAILTIPESKTNEEYQMLDERLLLTPAVAVERSKKVTSSMAAIAVDTLRQSMQELGNYNPKQAEAIRAGEENVDQYEDHIGSYLVHLSAQSMTNEDSAEVSQLLHIIGDFERISDHALNVLSSAEEMAEKKLTFSPDAQKELQVLLRAVDEILGMTLTAFQNDDLATAAQVEPLEQVIDTLQERLKRTHIARLKRQECTIEMGFILCDLLNNLERVSDHCSNIAGCMLEMTHDGLDIHEYLHQIKDGNTADFRHAYDFYLNKYQLPA